MILLAIVLWIACHTSSIPRPPGDGQDCLRGVVAQVGPGDGPRQHRRGGRGAMVLFQTGATGGAGDPFYEQYYTPNLFFVAKLKI